MVTDKIETKKEVWILKFLTDNIDFILRATKLLS